MEISSDLSDRIKAITTDPKVDDFFIVISSEGGGYLIGKAIGPDIISALAKTIVEQKGGLAAINRMQLAIFKAKELAKQLVMQKTGLAH